jgi:hypothetical protein
LVISGPFRIGDKLGVLMFIQPRADKDGVGKSAAVSKGLVAVEIHPQYLGAGTSEALMRRRGQAGAFVR